MCQVYGILHLASLNFDSQPIVSETESKVYFGMTVGDLGSAMNGMRSPLQQCLKGSSQA